MKKTFNKIIMGMFIFVYTFISLRYIVNAESVNFTYNPDDGYLTLNVNKTWTDGDYSFKYAEVTCYLESNFTKRENGVKIKFNPKTGEEKIKIAGTYNIRTWESGSYKCNLTVYYSKYNNGDLFTFDKGPYSFQHKAFSYKLTLDGNGSARFDCNNVSNNGGKVSYPASGKCSVEISNNTVTLPKVDETNFNGWGTSKNCTSGIVSGKSITLKHDKDVTYYACYTKKENNGAIDNPSTTTKYTVTLKATGTVKFSCPQKPTNAWKTTTVGNDGNCQATLASGTTFTLPTVNESDFKGWSTSSNCSNPKTGDVKVSGKVTYYACYGNNQSGSKETINGYRYLLDGAVDGQPCGTKWFIQYCIGQTCYYCDPKVSGTCSEKPVSRQKLANSASVCNVSSSSLNSDVGNRYIAIPGDNYKCGDTLYITTCTGTGTNKKCNYTSVNGDTTKVGTVNADNLKTSQSTAKTVCESNELDDDDKKCPKMEVEYDNTSEGSYQLCYDEDMTMGERKELLEEYYQCDVDNGYFFDKTYVVLQSEEECNDYICKATYAVRCTKESSGIKPIVNISPAVVGNNNIGVISIKATALEGEINAYYVSEYYTNPTLSNDDWEELDSPNFTIESTPGTVYVWVKDTEGNISNVVSATVVDNNNSNNTLEKIALYDANGEIQTPTTISYSGLNSNKYVMMSNDLRNDSKVLADAFNPYAMEYKIEVASPTLAVYATLTSSDAKYVAGYEPRTVNLNYGTNTILIKIQDKEGKVRTYTILVTRTDDRTSDNTLSDLKVSVGNIEFNSNVTDYKIEIPKNTKSVDVTSTIASNVASYVAGYEPGNVSITGDTTVKLIKVKSQTGSTRTYVLTFVKEGTDEIKDKTLQLVDLVIPDVYVAFESDVANYSFSVPYEMDSIDVKPVVNNENSTYTLSRKRKTDSDYKVGSNIGVPLDVGENFIEIKVQNNEGKESYYRITVIRKEFGLGISSDTALKDLRVLNYDIKFEPNKKEYTVKIKQEKTLVITAVPASNRAEVFIRGNDELTGFSTVRVKVVAENGEYETYSIDIKKDAFNKTIEIASIVVASVIILGTSAILIINKKRKSRKEYFSE